MPFNGPLPPVPELDNSGRMLAELAHVNLQLGDLITLLGGEYVTHPKRVSIDAAHPWRDTTFDTDDAWHSVQISNLSAVPLLVGFGAGDGQPGRATDVVAASSAVVITQPFTSFSVGIDPAVMPAGATVVYLRFYARPVPPNGWRLA